MRSVGQPASGLAHTPLKCNQHAHYTVCPLGREQNKRAFLRCSPHVTFQLLTQTLSTGSPEYLYQEQKVVLLQRIGVARRKTFPLPCDSRLCLSFISWFCRGSKETNSSELKCHFGRMYKSRKSPRRFISKRSTRHVERTQRV